MLNPIRSKQFKKSYKLAKSRGKNMKKLVDVMDKLIKEEPLEQKHRDHNLTGDYVGCRECHIYPNNLKIWPMDGIESCRKSTIVSGSVLINTEPLTIVDFRRFEPVYWPNFEVIWV